MKKPKILLAGYFGASNVGDEAILFTQVNMFKPYSDLTVLSINPLKTCSTYNVKSKKLPSLLRFNELVTFINLIKNCDFLILGGGGFIANKLQPFSIYYWLLLISIAKAFNKKVLLLAVGCGPFRSGIHSTLIRLGLNKVDVILLRDITSKYFLKDFIKINVPMTVTADIAFLIEKYIPISNHFIPIINGKAEPLVLFVLCARFQFKKFGKEQNNPKISKYISSIAKIADFIIEELHGTPIFLPFYPDDFIFYKKIVNNMKNRNFILLKYTENIGTILSLFRRMDLVIGARYHSILFSIITNTLVLPIVYQHKGYSIVQKIDLPYLEIGDNIEWPDVDIDVSDAKKSVLTLLANKSCYLRVIRLKKKELVEKAHNNLLIIKKMLFE